MPVNLQVGWDNDLPAGFVVSQPLGAYYTGAAVIDISSRYFAYQSGIPGRETYANRVKSLIEWAESHEYILIQSRRDYPSFTIDGYDYSVRRPVATGWIVCPAENPIASQHTPWTSTQPIHCASCDLEHPHETYVCPNSNLPISCPTCAEHNVEVMNISNGPFGMPRYVCRSCGTECHEDGCESLIDGRRGYEYCAQHGQFAECHACGRGLSWANAADPPRESRSGFVCEDCEAGICPVCDNWADEMLWSDQDSAHVCMTCSRRWLLETHEEVESENDEIAEMQTIPGREMIRKCGIEIEGANGTMTGNDLAYMLSRLRLCRYDSMLSYHTEANGFCKVERDSSVDWECVMGPLNMADKSDILKLNQTMKIIRDGVHAGQWKLDLRCGLHIHVSAEKVGLAQAYNLSHLFTFLEDPFYRIAAAKWPVHRALQGNEATRSSPKFNRKLEFFTSRGGRGGGHDDHYYALSFSNYFRSMRNNCQCGAVGAGFWDECVCEVLPKCTFEFRLFNTTANSRKLRAYLALCQALVAKAIEMPEIRKPAEQYPGLPFVMKTLKGMEPAERETLMESWVPRLEFIFNELPLTAEEKDAIEYCVNNSEVGAGLGDGWRDFILREEDAA